MLLKCCNLQNQLNQERRLARKLSSNEEERSPVIIQEGTKKPEPEDSSGVLYSRDTTVESAMNGSQTEGSEKEASRSESSFDADSEASESESASKQTAFSSCSNTSALHVNHINVKMPHTKPSDSNDEKISSAISKLSFCDTINEDEKSSCGDPDNECDFLCCFISGLKEAMGASAGQWVYVSDAHVQVVPESRVLNAQAYLLFYERLLI
ncbi:hypothetical protein CIB84_008160 [Bambusicola thoracicus]|uniref:USP domain-containing protein n=1 Tax=Bambusicola thoracicus TaxID=9083 RepID=A0A2P4SVG1_BAMTH|nr:hypothetical protein CIB84_008160 [Bambusicola thoracicus]